MIKTSKQFLYIFSCVFLLPILVSTSIAQPFKSVLDWQMANSNRCVQAILAKDFVKAHSFFTPEMKNEFPADTLRLFWEQFEKKAGRIIKKFDTRIDIDPVDTNLVAIVHSLRCATGNWDIRTAFKSTPEIDGFFIAQFKPKYGKHTYTVPEYANADSVKVRDIMIGKGTDWEINGTLTLPLATGKYPFVIIIHGSGPLDEDGTYVANKPYADLAWGLASRGIGVLRFEKRTRAYYSTIRSKKIQVTPDFESTEDAIEAFKALKLFKETDTNAIFLLGHGTGGMFIPRAAKKIEGLKGMIMLGAPSRPLEDVLLDQLEYVLTLDTIIDITDAKKKLEKIKKQHAAVKSKSLSPDTPNEQLLLETPAPYWLSLKNYNPAELTKSLSIPCFIAYGERDFQSSMKDFNLWKKSLSSSKQHAKNLYKIYPSLNYLFMEGVGKASPMEYTIYDHVDKQLIEDINQWVKELIKK